MTNRSTHKSPFLPTQREQKTSRFGWSQPQQQQDTSLKAEQDMPNYTMRSAPWIRENNLVSGMFEPQPIQAKSATSEQEQKNKTGLPNDLKASIESMSGLSMDDVKVYYNSSKPASLNALAYTQGTSIHVAPNQEKHLAHEAWHVVQQMQGRVKPTMYVKGVAINDDKSLEAEAEQAVRVGKVGNRTSIVKNGAFFGSGCIQRMSNEDKIKLVEFKANQLLQQLARNTRLTNLLSSSNITGLKKHALYWGLKAVKDGILNEIRIMNSELNIRNNKKQKFEAFRQNNPKYYGGEDGHKIANVDIELIREGLDRIEDDLVTTKVDAVNQYNLIADQISHQKQVNSADLGAKIDNSSGEIIIGGKIKIQPRHFGDPTGVELDLKPVLRAIRKIIQTPIGFDLINNLVQSTKNSQGIDIKIYLDRGTKSWHETTLGQQEGKGYIKGKKITLNHGKVAKGTGEASSSNVYFDTQNRLDLSGKDPKQNPNIPRYIVPDDAALFHELTHALHAVTGKKDPTPLKQREKIEGEPQGNLYTPGAWVEQEEKNTIEAETEYLKQIGFPFYRIMYGLLGERIDKYNKI